jgi:hypothetical protein
MPNVTFPPFVQTEEEEVAPKQFKLQSAEEEDSEAQYRDETQKRKNNRQMASKRRFAKATKSIRR